MDEAGFSPGIDVNISSAARYRGVLTTGRVTRVNVGPSRATIFGNQGDCMNVQLLIRMVVPQVAEHRIEEPIIDELE
jgi:hypothetical protein